MNSTLRAALAAWLVLAAPGVSAEENRRSGPATTGPQDSVGTSFWYGDALPTPFANSLMNHFLTDPAGVNALMGSIMLFDNSNGDKGLTVREPGTWDGYTLVSSLAGDTSSGTTMYTILIDMNGEVVREWPLFPFPAKMLPGGFVLGGGSNGLAGHQEEGSLVQMDWCGRPVWSWTGIPGAAGGARQHHDYQRQGSPVGYYAPGLIPLPYFGKTLVLAHDNPPQTATANVSDTALEDDALYEVDWSGKVLWEWHAWQHVDQMGFDAPARLAIKTIAVGAPQNIGGGFTETDWQHLNNANYLGPNAYYERGDLRFHPDNIIIDGRSSNLIAIIARHDHPQGAWKSGDIVWRVGPNFGPGNPEYALGQIIGQHHAHMIPRGLPGAGHILVFDNGGLAGFGPLMPGMPTFWPNKWRNYSRVLEFDPQTFQVVWEYRNDGTNGDRKFFSWFISSAQRLPNGNTLITEGSDGRIFEVTPQKQIVWEWISPYRAPPQSGFGNSVYRAYRVPSWWVPVGMTCPAS